MGPVRVLACFFLFFFFFLSAAMALWPVGMTPYRGPSLSTLGQSSAIPRNSETPAFIWGTVGLFLLLARPSLGNHRLGAVAVCLDPANASCQARSNKEKKGFQCAQCRHDRMTAPAIAPSSRRTREYGHALL